MTDEKALTITEQKAVDVIPDGRKRSKRAALLEEFNCVKDKVDIDERLIMKIINKLEKECHLQSPKKRYFVFCYNGMGTGAKVVKEAGYRCKSEENYKKLAYNLLHDKNVKKGIRLKEAMLIKKGILSGLHLQAFWSNIIRNKDTEFDEDLKPITRDAITINKDGQEVKGFSIETRLAASEKLAKSLPDIDNRKNIDPKKVTNNFLNFFQDGNISELFTNITGNNLTIEEKEQKLLI